MNKDENKKVVTRFAPSPTGFMHVGNVRTALYSYLWARHNNGKFILRIEDTDKEREVEGSIEHIIESLKWLGINWDEGMEVGGLHAPYKQSERLDIYKKYAEKLIEDGYAYPDPHTEEEIEVWRKSAEDNKELFLYRNHRPETFEVWDGKKPLRFKIKDIKSYAWHDLVFGNLSAGPEALDDFILIKGDGYPTYNFAHIVDDIEMEVTHVMRGQEFISSTPKFLAVYEALGMTPPLFASMPHILGDGGNKKLGKRDGAKDLLEYRTDGYLPSALVNFLALLGWNPGDEREIFTMKELENEFNITRVGNHGSQLNTDKLNWINKEHMKKIPLEDHFEYVKKFLPKELLEDKNYDDVMLAKLTPLIWGRISYFGEIKKMYEDGELGYFFADPKIDNDMLVWKSLKADSEGLNKTKKILKKEIEILENISHDDWTLEEIKSHLWPLAEETGKGEVLWPLRVALSGREKSPDPFELADILGKEIVIRRLNAIIL